VTAVRGDFSSSMTGDVTENPPVLGFTDSAASRASHAPRG
jgi:hypothetical protein